MFRESGGCLGASPHLHPEAGAGLGRDEAGRGIERAAGEELIDRGEIVSKRSGFLDALEIFFRRDEGVAQVKPQLLEAEENILVAGELLPVAFEQRVVKGAQSRRVRFA